MRNGGVAWLRQEEEVVVWDLEDSHTQKPGKVSGGQEAESMRQVITSGGERVGRMGQQLGLLPT